MTGPAGGPGDPDGTGRPRQPVVGAAVLRDGRVLAARRTSPPAVAGRWELPGGKVEEGERPADALVREVAEELGCTVRVVGWLPGSAPIGESHQLTVAVAELLPGSPGPDPVEHDRVRWLDADELDTVDWLEPDRPFLHHLRDRLARPAAGGTGGQWVPMRAIFFDEDDATAVADRLRADGFSARVERERLAGEDDDEDHPWAVLSDAPEPLVELLVDAHDGWLDADPGAAPGAGGVPPPPPPPDLPTAPRRIKRPD